MFNGMFLKYIMYCKLLRYNLRLLQISRVWNDKNVCASSWLSPKSYFLLRATYFLFMSTHHNLSAFQLLPMFSLSLTAMSNKENSFNCVVPVVRGEHKNHTKVDWLGCLWNLVIKWYNCTDITQPEKVELKLLKQESGMADVLNCTPRFRNWLIFRDCKS